MTAATQRLVSKRQTLDEAYAPPANFLEIEVMYVTFATRMLSFGRTGARSHAVARVDARQSTRQTMFTCSSPITHGVGKNRYTDYEVRLRVSCPRRRDAFTRVAVQTNLPVFKHKESSVRRRYSEFEWLKNELERDSKVRAGGRLGDYRRRHRRRFRSSSHSCPARRSSDSCLSVSCAHIA